MEGMKDSRSQSRLEEAHGSVTSLRKLPWKPPLALLWHFHTETATTNCHLRFHLACKFELLWT